MTKDEQIRELFKKYDLFYDRNNPESRDNDVYIHKHYKTITRPGIQKIQRKAGIKIDYDPINNSCGPDWAVIRATGHYTDKETGEYKTYTTFGSANAGNCRTGYYAEMAEKRVMSRIVLSLVGLYELGFYGNDEVEDGEKEQPKVEKKVEKKSLFKTEEGV